MVHRDLRVPHPEAGGTVPRPLPPPQRGPGQEAPLLRSGPSGSEAPRSRAFCVEGAFRVEVEEPRPVPSRGSRDRRRRRASLGHSPADVRSLAGRPGARPRSPRRPGPRSDPAIDPWGLGPRRAPVRVPQGRSRAPAGERSGDRSSPGTSSMAAADRAGSAGPWRAGRRRAPRAGRGSRSLQWGWQGGRARRLPSVDCPRGAPGTSRGAARAAELPPGHLALTGRSNKR